MFCLDSGRSLKMDNQICHSSPTWIWGPKSVNSKFGGGIISGGYASVDERLRLIKREFPEDLTSGHFLHEIQTDIDGLKHFNNKNAISWKGLVDGINRGIYPSIAALTVPAFGIKGVEDGALLSPNPAICEMYFRLHVDSIVKTSWLKQEGFGRAIHIVWPAWDSQRMNHGAPGTKPLAREAAWERLVTTWVDICRAAMKKLDKMKIASDGPLFWLEWKPEDPGQDYINTPGLAIRWCKEVNRRLEAEKAAINNEWAHALIGGTTVEECTDETIKAGLFTGFVHVNSANLAIVKFDEMTGELLEGAPAYDMDWYVGAGGQKRWDDQQRAVKLILASGKPPLFEHDIDPAGDNPRDYYAQSRENLEKMIAAASATPQ